MFVVGDRVEKVKGYRWPGEVVASFVTLKGEYRVVVECTVPEVAGALHIYAPEQIAPRSERKFTGPGYLEQTGYITPLTKPCGECHLRPGEVCDICRALAGKAN